MGRWNRGIGRIVRDVAFDPSAEIFGALKGLKPGIPEEYGTAYGAMTGLSQTARDTIQKAMDDYKAGKITSAQEATLGEQKGTAEARLKESMGAGGMMESTAARSEMQHIGTETDYARQTLSQMNLSTALSEAGIATADINILMAQAGAKMQADQIYSQNIMGLLGAAGKIVGMGMSGGASGGAGAGI